ncbi:MAG TPA: hypothetical protein VFD56_04770 [Chitinophagaceae bacterium]|nr:hypothetical protein [Chitinophagaceae bacterium]
MKNLLIVCIVLSLSCQKKNDFVYNVPREFEPHVQRFISEAGARGHRISINNLIIKYESSSSLVYCATSNVISSGNDVQKIISIKSTSCWQTDTQAETIIFHELGHCILGRDHDNSLMPKGDPKSIMYPDNTELYSPCVYAIGDSCNKLYRRAYYIDELFNPSTPAPDWGK